MIKKVIVTNHLGESLELELTRPEKSGFIVKSINGLGPVKAGINTTDVATYDGGLYNSSRLGTRNIVMALEFMNGLSGLSIEKIRHKSYKFFPTKMNITMRIVTDERTLETEGYVESNEPDIFSKNEGCSVSIICPFPYFYGVGEDNQYAFSGVEPLFEFPFSCETVDGSNEEPDESVTPDNSALPLIQMGNIKIVHQGNLVYKGDTEIGIRITLHAYGDVHNITVYNTGTRETMFIDTDKIASLTGSGIIDHDEIIINTIDGKKYIWLLRDGKYTNILNCINRDASWFQLNMGDNIFAYTAESGQDNLTFTIEHKVIYKGV